MDEGKLSDEASRGMRASNLLNSEIYKESIGKVRQGILDSWAASPIRDVEGQTNLRLMLKLLTDLEANIKHVANTGKLAEQQLAHERDLKARAKAAAKGLIARFT